MEKRTYYQRRMKKEKMKLKEMKKNKIKKNRNRMLLEMKEGKKISQI